MKHFLMLSACLTQNFPWRYQGFLEIDMGQKTEETFVSGSINTHMLQKINTGEGGDTAAVSARREHVSAVPAAPRVSFQPLSLGLADPGFSEQCAQ